MRSLRTRLRVGIPALLAAALTVGAVSTAAAAPAAATGSQTVLITGSAGGVQAARGLVAHDGHFTDLPVIGGFAAQVSPAQRAALAAVPGVRVSENAPMRVTDADFGAGSHDAAAVYPQTDGAPAAWAAGLDGSGVTVAVVDTGISNTGDLAGKVVDGYDFSGEGSYTTDSFGHGTFVAGTIAGSGAASGGAIKGVAPGARLVSLKVAGADGSSDVVRVISAVQWAVNHAAVDHIRVLNLSLGTDSTQLWRIDPLDAAVEGAWKAGLVVTVAAGNSGPGGISKPGDDPYVITVGAADDATTPDAADDTVPAWSSGGPTAAGVAKPDLIAPATHVVSTRAVGSTIDVANPAARIDPAYFRGSGTSFSAPQTAAAAALLLQQRPGLTPNQVKGLLASTARPLPGVAATQQGAGELNIAALLTAPTGPAANGGLGFSDGSGSPVASQGSLAGGAAPAGGDSAAWSSAAWSSAAWSSSAWSSAAWSSAAWNSAAWSSSAWSGLTWGSSAWSSSAWSASGWAATAFWSAAWN